MSDPGNTAHDIDGTIAWVTAVTFSIVALFGSALWNRANTIDVRISTVVVVSGLIGLPVAVRTLHHWFRRREKLDPPPHWNLKQDSPGTWVLAGITSAALQAIFIAVAVYYLASLLAQHAGGSQIRAPARVEEVEHFTSRKARCRTRVRFAWNWEQNILACTVPRHGPSLSSRQLHAGDTVVLIVANNIFGSALVAVELPDAADAQQVDPRDRVKKRGA